MVGFYPDLDLARKHFYQSVIQFSGRSEGVVYTILIYTKIIDAEKTGHSLHLAWTLSTLYMSFSKL